MAFQVHRTLSSLSQGGSAVLFFLVMSHHVTHVDVGSFVCPAVLERVNLHKCFVQGVECMFLAHEMG